MTDPAALAGRYRSIAFDLDGTVYLEDEVVPAAPATLRSVRELGVRVGFVTNNAMRPPAAVVEKLSRLGIKATVEEVQTSSQAAVRLLGGEAGLRGKGVLVIGGPGLREALSGAGAHLLEPEAWRSAEIVAAGMDTELTYEKLRAASLAIAAGARFVASNADASLPTPEGPWPGAGSVLALLETATGARPEIAGKPQPALFETVAAALGPGPRLMVGDRVDTDLAGAQALGWATALVLTGVTRPRALLDVQMVPDYLLADVGGLLQPPGPEIRVEEGRGGPRAVAEQDGTPVGWLACRWDGSSGSLDELWVEPEWRGRLVGTRLLLAAIPGLRAAGVHT
ncbi:MAG TPA: HAD-IIA family hydrolase, partial [Actinomycetes bacterium]|nr:HAD-IIA family hydrolase [Actinomycetes bacterium]